MIENKIKIFKPYLNYWFSIQGTSQIIQLFENEKYDIRFVGGCVRDALLGNKNSDIDLAINCDPKTVSDILSKRNIKIFNYGKKFGTITAKIGKTNFEITSLREDINQRGRSTDVIFTNDWLKDAKRRDFTINAMYLSPNGSLTDYFKGLKDIEQKKIRFIGDINKRVSEDYLRIFRYYRFLGIFENPIIIKGYEDILRRHCEDSFNYLSNDLLRQEILKMFHTAYPLNSFFNKGDNKEEKFWLKLIKKHFVKTQYVLGLNKCLNKIDLLINTLS